MLVEGIQPICGNCGYEPAPEEVEIEVPETMAEMAIDEPRETMGYVDWDAHNAEARTAFENNEPLDY